MRVCKSGHTFLIFLHCLCATKVSVESMSNAKSSIGKKICLPAPPPLQIQTYNQTLVQTVIHQGCQTHSQQLEGCYIDRLMKVIPLNQPSTYSLLPHCVFIIVSFHKNSVDSLKPLGKQRRHVDLLQMTGGGEIKTYRLVSTLRIKQSLSLKEDRHRNRCCIIVLGEHA